MYENEKPDIQIALLIYFSIPYIHFTLSRLAAHRSDTTRPPDEAAGCCHCLYDVDSVGAVEWSKPGAATAYMTVEKVKNGEEEKEKKNKCFGGGQVQS